MQAYDFLAPWFESLNSDCDYPRWSQYFIEGLRARGAGKRGLELGCGSGAFSRALAAAGYEMTGADLSVPMLSKAQELAGKEGVRVQFVRADAACLRTPVRYDFILSPNDCFNYIAPARLPQAFAHIRGCLCKGGLFWFDISSAYKMREKVANNMFGDDRDDVTCIAFNSLKEDRVETELTLFVREGELFRRYDESHVRYIHEEDAVLAALRGAGFSLLSVEGHLGADKAGSDRLNFICVRA